jgi:hypothetical protein
MEPKKKRGRPAASDGYDRRVAHYENERGLALLAELQRLRGGVSVTALLRQLTREEAARQKLDTAGAE